MEPLQLLRDEGTVGALFDGKAVTGGFNIPKDAAYGIYAAYDALVYLTPLAGGFLADKLLGFRKAIIYGALLMAAGQFVLATSSGTEIISQKTYEQKLAEAKEAAGKEAEAAGKDLKKAEEEVKEPAVDTRGQPGIGSELLLFAGLALLVTGNGFFGPNISSLIGRFYAQGDHAARRSVHDLLHGDQHWGVPSRHSRVEPLGKSRGGTTASCSPEPA